jgi:hypothetical protein
MKASEADARVTLNQTVLHCRYMKGVHKVTLNWYLPDGRASVHILEVDSAVDPFFHKIYKKGDNMDCLLENLSFP